MYGNHGDYLRSIVTPLCHENRFTHIRTFRQPADEDRPRDFGIGLFTKVVPQSPPHRLRAAASFP